MGRKDDLYDDDPISSPSHYRHGDFEVIEIIESLDLNFHRGNVLKYLLRAGKKRLSSESEDLKKARWYLDREIRRIEG